MIYLNHAGTSWPKPAVVQSAAAAALAADPADWGATFARDHEVVARAFGVSDPERLLLTPGCTSALGVAIADQAWESGDRVLISAFEHHALHRPVQKLAGLGVEVVVVPPTETGPLDLDALEAELARGRVRLVAMTAASNVTGECLPWSEIIERAHAHGARCLLDAAQVTGWVELDVTALALDFLTFAGHKALQAPWGIGGLYVAPHVSTDTPAATCALTPAAAERQCAPMPGYCDTGSVDRAALAGLAAGITWLAEPERRDRLERAVALTERLAAGVAELAAFDVVRPLSRATRLPVLSLRPRGGNVGALVSKLAERGMLVSGGLQCAPLAHRTLGTDPHGTLRVSFGPQSRSAHADAMLAALTELDARG